MKLHIADNFTLPLEAVTQTFAILAKRGVGKTYTGAVMVEEMLEQGQQVVVADPIGVWFGLRSSADGKSAGYPIVVFGGDHADVPLEEGAGEVIAGAVIEHGFSAILDLSLLRKAAQVRFMTAFAETLYRLNRKPLHFAVDEADAFAPQRPMKGEERLLGAFEDIVRRGRARGLGVTLITQRAAVINKNVLTQIEVLVCMRTIAPQDREAIDAWIEVHGTEKQRDAMMAELPSLPIGAAYFWSPGWLDIFKRVQVSERRTFDSSSTPKIGEKIIAPKEVAKVDLDKLGQQIKSTAEKAKENDPSDLKRRLAEAKREIETLKKVKPERVRKEPSPTLADRVAVRLETLRARHEEIRQSLSKTATSMVIVANNLAELTATIRKGVVHTSGAGREARSEEGTPRTPNIGSNPRPDTNGESSLGRCERAILAALAQYPQGRTTSQIAVLSGYSGTSGGFNNSLGKLRSAEYITRANPVQITQEGLAALGDYDELPQGDELIAYWMSKLGRCERKILETLTEAYPQAMTPDELGERTGYSPTSGGFNNSLGKLRTLELITRGRPIKASDEFFQ